MDLAIGLPNAVPGTTGEQLTEWAQRAEARGFSSLGTIDRIAYPNLEPLTSLAAAAAVTERIGLATTVLLGPLRVNPVALAKQVASLHTISGGRMTLGIGLGGREDDYEIAGVDTSTRGRDLDAMLARIEEVWKGEEMGPDHPSDPARPRRRLRRGLLRARRPLRRGLDRGGRPAGPVRRVAPGLRGRLVAGRPL
jgi:alkanesulfonate monooxygenase SsuD/methylene tetrahydromethanopterin reductase-like flavin-dependent oxidoreductase (luciferase family)